LIRARRVLIVTGFAVLRDTPETDGPPGAAVLGRALRSLGARVRYVTDRVSAPIVGAALAALGEPPEILVGPDDEDAVCALVAADHLVVAGVSQWGGSGVVAAPSRLAGRDLLHTPKLERHLVEACVAAGASDGVTRRREPTVDGLPIEAHAAVVELLRWAARSGIIPA